MSASARKLPGVLTIDRATRDAIIAGFRWWSVEALQATDDSVFPAHLAERHARLLVEGSPPAPIDITVDPADR